MVPPTFFLTGAMQIYNADEVAGVVFIQQTNWTDCGWNVNQIFNDDFIICHVLVSLFSLFSIAFDYFAIFANALHKI